MVATYVQVSKFRKSNVLTVFSKTMFSKDVEIFQSAKSFDKTTLFNIFEIQDFQKKIKADAATEAVL